MKKRVLVTGSSGLIGQELCARLRAEDYEVRTLSRSSRSDFQWSPESGDIDSQAVDGVDAVVHLAGETVAQRWTAGAKQRIKNSRVDGTRLLVDCIGKSGSNPTFISASGINYYGYNLEHEVDEFAPLGVGFLAEVCHDWEGAVQPLVQDGSRCVFVRTGVVLSDRGGALAKMLPAFRFGFGGPIGSGDQRMSWISLEDVVGAFIECLKNEKYTGPVNAVSPNPVSNKDFAKALGGALRRPAFAPLPTAVVKLMFGEMASETLLSNLSVRPSKLEEFGFKWSAPTIDKALVGL